MTACSAYDACASLSLSLGSLRLSKCFDQGSDFLDAHQKVRRKPAPVAAGQSTSPLMDYPTRAAPQIPPYEALALSQRPSLHEYERLPGTGEKEWDTPAAAIHPVEYSSAPPLPRKPAPQPYQEVVPLFSRPQYDQHSKNTAVNEPNWLAPEQHVVEYTHNTESQTYQYDPRDGGSQTQAISHNMSPQTISGYVGYPQGPAAQEYQYGPRDGRSQTQTISHNMVPQIMAEHASHPQDPSAQTYQYDLRDGRPQTQAISHNMIPQIMAEHASHPQDPSAQTYQYDPRGGRPQTQAVSHNMIPQTIAGYAGHHQDPAARKYQHNPRDGRPQTQTISHNMIPQTIAGQAGHPQDLAARKYPHDPRDGRPQTQTIPHNMIPQTIAGQAGHPQDPAARKYPHDPRDGRPQTQTISHNVIPQTTAGQTGHPQGPAAQPKQPTGNQPFSGQPIPSDNSQPSIQPPSYAPRSASQPPGDRSASQPTQQSNKLRKASQPNLLAPKPNRSADASPGSSPLVQSRGRSGSLASPPSFNDVSIKSVSSQPNLHQLDAGIADGKIVKRRSWMPGIRSRNTSQDITGGKDGMTAWIIGEQNRVQYDLQLLGNAQPVPELWNDNADTLVYLFPRESRRGPSFKIPSRIFSSSQQLRALAFGDLHAQSRHRGRSFDGRSTLSVNDAMRRLAMRQPNTPPYTPTMAAQENLTSSDGSAESISSLGETSREGHLYFPYTNNRAPQSPQEESDHLVSARNLFAFLMGQPLVATRSSPTVFAVLCLVANHLKWLDFSNVDGSTYGETVTNSLPHYIEGLGLIDIASSREKTLEGIVLGERLRSIELYNEAFTHAVGKYEAVKNMKSPVWEMVTVDTRNRLERAYMDLTQRQHNMQVRLTDCEFSSLFAGSAASTSSDASKVVRFKAWKSSFLVMRKHILSYYKDLHGDWPPKAKSKKNNFVQSGFNRLFLKGIYEDFCSLYDFLVDRDSLTTRTMTLEDNPHESDPDPAIEALRQILSEYDRSCPPVQPPMPFDIPKVPTMATLEPRHYDYSPKARQQAEYRKLQEHETILILTKSHNLDSDMSTPFLTAFRALEQKESRGKTVQDLADQRFGQWLFVYVIIQALPMLVMDAPGLRHNEGVEYFLCQPPLGGVPWMEEGSSLRRAWYGVAGSSGVVALPSDIVDHGVEAIYRRSHCWTAAERWLAAGHASADMFQDQGGEVPQNGQSASDIYDVNREFLGSPIGYDEGRQGRLGSLGRQLSVVAESENLSPSSASDRETLNSQSGRSQSKPRSHSASNRRMSLAFGLEQLPVPPGYSMSPHISPNLTPGGSPPISTRPRKSSYGFGGDADHAGAVGAGNADSQYVQGKSFDDILQDVKNQKSTKDKMKRKSFIGKGGL